MSLCVLTCCVCVRFVSDSAFGCVYVIVQCLNSFFFARRVCVCGSLRVRVVVCALLMLMCCVVCCVLCVFVVVVVFVVLRCVMCDV